MLMKLALLLVLFVITNFGFFDRMALLLLNGRWFTIIVYLAIWAISLGALFIAAFQPNRFVRHSWAILLAIATTFSYTYVAVSGTSFSVFDALSLWSARHEAGRAFEFYQSHIFASMLVLFSVYTAISIGPVPRHRLVRLALKWFFWTPAVPVILISGIIILKQGGGSQAMPSQFQPLAVGAVSASKLMAFDVPKRHKVEIDRPNPAKVKHIVYLVGESVRYDAINWKAGNPVTPRLATMKNSIINFGTASSGGNCSNYSNAILRLSPSDQNVSGTILTNPTIWQYAKKAGYRTVYIDSQSGLNKDPGSLQNFMTVSEASYIDRHVRFKGIAPSQLDLEANKVILQELQSDKPVFLYVNKNGAHFPYDTAYPSDRQIFTPTVTSAQSSDIRFQVNSYKNAINWAIDKVMYDLFRQIDLEDTLILYTSDHGQAFYKGRLTHCTVKNPSPEEGMVPMFALTGNPEIRAELVKGAKLNYSRATHFSILPTFLKLMGYDRSVVTEKYGPDLTMKSNRRTAFTSGDIFGFFRKQITWNDVDLERFNDQEKPLEKYPPLQVNNLKAIPASTRQVR